MNASNAILAEGSGVLELENPWAISGELRSILRPLRGKVGAIRCARCGCALTYIEHPSCPHLRQLGATDEGSNCFHSHVYNHTVSSELLQDVYRSSVITGLDARDQLLSENKSAHYFGLWGRSVLSRGYSGMFSGFDSPASVTPSYCHEVLPEVKRVLTDTRFPDCHGNPFEVSGERNVELYFGIAADTIALSVARDGQADLLPLTVWCWDTTAFRIPQILNVPEAELHRCANRFNNHGNITRGPFFFVAVVNSRGTALRLFLYPVALFSNRVAPVDSETERQDVCHSWACGEQLYKGLRLRDQMLLHPSLRSQLGAPDFALLYRPDSTVFYGRRIRVKEVKGYDDDEHIKYIESFTIKERYYEKLESLGHFEFEAIDASTVWKRAGNGYPQDSLPALFQNGEAPTP